MARLPHFHLRPVSVILQLAVAQAKGKAGWSAAFPRPATGKGFRRAVAAVFFVARSLPVGLSGSETSLGIADFAIPFDLFAAADPALAAVAVAVGPAVLAAAVGPVVVVAAAGFAVVVDFAVAADLACSFDFVCFFAAGMGKGRAVVAISCFLTPQSFF